MAALPLVILSALLCGWAAAASAGACLMAVIAAAGRRHPAMSLWYGIAVALDAQALLLSPFFLAVAIRHRASIRAWLIAPSIGLAATTPWLITGWHPAGLDLAAGGAPGIWPLAAAIMPGHASQFTGLALAAAVGTAAAFVARMQVVPLDRPAMIRMASLSALLTASLLPGMQMDDFMLAAFLTLVCAAVRPARSTLLAAGLVQGALLVAIGAVPGLGAAAIAIGAACMIAATWIAAQPLIAPHANDNRDGSHRIPSSHGLRGTLRFDMMQARAAWPRGSELYVREQDA